MAISTFPVPAAGGGGGGGLQAYKGLPGTNGVNIAAGFYLVRATDVEAFPITVGSQEIQSNTQLLNLETEATSLAFASVFDEFNQVALPNATSISIRGAGINAGNFIVCGQNGYVANSTDGITFTQRTIPNFTGFLFGAYAGTNFSGVVGENGYIATSTDGITFTQRTIPNFTSLLANIVFEDDIYLVNGFKDTQVFRSTDLITWTNQTIPSASNNDIRQSRYVDNLFIILGRERYFISSADGINWTQRTIPGSSNFANGVAFGNGLYMVVGNAGLIVTSPDTITWTTRTPPSAFSNTSFQDVAFAKGVFVINAVNSHLITTDSSTYEIQAVPNGGNVDNGTTFSKNDVFLSTGAGAYLGTFSTDPQFLVLEPTQLTDLT